jgi:putative transposase
VRLVYLVFARIVGWLTLLGRGRGSLQVEVLVLRYENAVLRRGDPRPRLDWADRQVVAMGVVDGVSGCGYWFRGMVGPWAR